MTRIRFEDLPSTNTPRNAENLNKLNNVVISSSEPNTGEEVWIQKGKNLYNPSNAYVTGASGQNISIIIDVLPNTTYTFSIGSYTWGEAKEYDASGTLLNSYGGTETSKIITFTTASTTKYVELPFYSGVSNIDINAIDFTQIQFEQGSNATDYEAYVDKKIFVKNNNDTYEEFINISDIKKVSNEVILYDNTSGASGDITLNETSANFKYIEILFRANTGGHSSLKVANPNGKYPLLSLIDDNGGDAVLWAKSTLYLISETSITVVRSHLQKIGSATVSETDNKMRILRVIGYK